jgi:hypothetical protein
LWVLVLVLVVMMLLRCLSIPECCFHKGVLLVHVLWELLGPLCLRPWGHLYTRLHIWKAISHIIEEKGVGRILEFVQL